MVFRLVARLLVLLNSNRRPFEIGGGIAMGLLLALLPNNNLIFWAILVTAFLVKLNLGVTLASFFLFSTFVSVFDPLLNRVGYAVLTMGRFEPFFTTLADLPVVPLTRFNNTLVMGALVSGVVVWLPVAFLSIGVVGLYRKHVHARIANSKLVKAIKASPWVQKLSGATRRVRRLWSVAG